MSTNESLTPTGLPTTYEPTKGRFDELIDETGAVRPHWESVVRTWTRLGPDEIVCEIRIPKLPAGAGSGYARLARVEGSFAIVNAAAVVDGKHCVIGIGGAVPAPVVVQVDLDSTDADEATLERVAAAARDACADAYDDLSGGADYRRAMAGVYARRAFELALEARDEQRKDGR